MEFMENFKPKFNYERYEKWVKCSIGWLSIEPDGILTTRLQGLGIIDAELYDVNKFDIEKPLDNDLLAFDHINIKSYLWVLGVYEFFRTVHQRFRENPELSNEKTIEIITTTKRELARIRVPLAKLEPSNKYKKIDYAVPKLGASDTQIGWEINPTEIVWYRDLSDLAISTLNKIRSDKINRDF